jgi:hypothetical protein
VFSSNAGKRIQEIAQRGKAGDKDTPTPPKSSAEMLYRFSSGRSVTIQEARSLSESGAFRDGKFSPPDERKG